MTDKTIKVIYADGNEENVPFEIRLEDLARKHSSEHTPQIVAARVNNKLRELTYHLEEDSKIEFVDVTSLDGARIYQRSLSFVFIRAAMELYKDIHVRVEHSLSGGLFCEFDYSRVLETSDIEKIQQRMKAIVLEDEPFYKEAVPKGEATEIFERFNMKSKIHLLNYREHDTINLYTCGWLRNYFYGYMVPSTGYLKKFDLMPYDNGVILRHPNKSNPFDLPEFEAHPKLAQVFKEAERWGEIVGVDYVAKLNDCIQEGCAFNVIKIAEALHEKKIAHIADMISESGKRLILIAGPSSSGKTTFANRLMIQLQVNGLRPITVSTDDYFVDRDKTPLDEDGNLDFESIDSVDTKQFNEDLSKLLEGEEVELPVFNFQVGKREYHGDKLKIGKDQPIIIEGIHGLNEKLTQKIAKKDKFKIYISALTQLNIDDHNRIPTTDTRLLRRIVRDNKYRGHNAQRTIDMWPSVRRGEQRNIFPFQEDADVMFNSALVYELAVLKKHAEPLLEAISEDEPENVEAKRLLKFLSYFESIENDKLIPYSSILKEFIGGSGFRKAETIE